MTPKPLLMLLTAGCLATVGVFAGPASASSGSLKILLLESDCGTPFSTSLQSLIAAQPGVGQVDSFDISAATPTLEQMNAYDEVIVTDDCGPLDTTSLGDHLADYEDVGGVVVATTFAWQSSGDEIQGRWEDDGYSPYIAEVGADDWGASALVGFDAASPLMQGVSSMGAYYRDNLGLTAGATQVAQWADGAGAVAYKGQAVAITGYFGDHDYSQAGQRVGDFPVIMANAGKWLGPHAVTVTKAGTGSGTVTSSSGGIACGATCSADYRLSPQVTLTAAPDAGSSFAGWSGDCSGSATCVVSASASRHVVATFTKNPPPSGIAKFGFLGHKVSINLRTGKGTGSVRCNNVAGDECVMELAVQASQAAHPSKKRLVKIGTAKGTVAGGQTGKLAFRLTRKGRRLLGSAKHHSLKVSLVGISKNRAGAASRIRQTVTLTARGKSRKH